MRIRGHPDLLILPSAGLSVARKRDMGLKTEVQGPWEVNIIIKLLSEANV